MKVAHNTYRTEHPNGDTVWTLHQTPVVTKHPDGTFTLRTGGFASKTTKDRLNRFSPAFVFAKDGEWFVRALDGTPVPFVEGIRVDASGDPIQVPAWRTKLRELSLRVSLRPSLAE